MKNRIILSLAALLLALVSIRFDVALADDSWRVSATIEVPSAGLVESVLPAGLVYATRSPVHFMREGMDLAPTFPLDFKLSGPDGNPRPVELFWKKEYEAVQKPLSPDKVTLRPGTGFVWEAPSPPNFKVNKIAIRIAETAAVGKVSIDGLRSQSWVSLARDAAIFRSGEGMQTQIAIQPDVYEKFRLSFSVYDSRYKDKAVPVEDVSVFGFHLDKSHAVEKVEQDFEMSLEDDLIEIRTGLPGAGLWVRSLEIETQTPFKGAYQVGREVYDNGIETFVGLKSGTASEMTENALRFSIQLDLFWPGRNLVLKLRPDAGFLGKVHAMDLYCNVPRIVFFADQPGTYTALSGTGDRVPVELMPSDPERVISQRLVFSRTETNQDWRPENVVKNYGIQGGPFNPEGYQWRGLVDIPREGFYRLRLTGKASLEDNPAGIRLVRGTTQTPYFWGRPDTATIDLAPQEEYDKKENLSVWTITLPKASVAWTVLRLTSSGIFQRKLKIEVPAHRPGSWQTWKTVLWQGFSAEPTHLHIDMRGFPKNETVLRASMSHGDNRPVEIAKTELYYPVLAAMFVAADPGPLEIYGGNPEAKAGKYDLELVRSHLAGTKPQNLELGEVRRLETSAWETIDMEKIFGEKGWGLYAVLIVVSLVLIVIIAKLFPKDSDHSAKSDSSTS